MSDKTIPRPLIGKTRAADVLHRMRDDIVSCVFRPDQKLKFDALREVYGVSFSTIREALSHLTSEQLVIAEGQRGFRVAPITREGLRDLTDARVLIERECLRLSIGNATVRSRALLLAAFHRLDELEAVMDAGALPPVAWEARHFEFHDALVATAGSSTLATIRRELWERARRYRRMSSIVRRQSPGQSLSPQSKRAEHRAIVEATLAGDAEHAVELLARHVRETADNLLAFLPDPAAPAP